MNELNSVLSQIKQLIPDQAKDIIVFITNLWNNNRYFRIISICTGSILMRYVCYIVYRKYYKLPPGPYGIPYLGMAIQFGPQNVINYLSSNIINYGPITSFNLALKTQIIINDPFLAKKIFQDDRTLDKAEFLSQNVQSFGMASGENWSIRRRIINSNLFPLLQSSLIENGTKQYLLKNILPKIDECVVNKNEFSIKNNLRPLIFSVIFYACFGVNISDENDEFYVEWSKLAQTHFKALMLESSKLEIFFGSWSLIKKIQKAGGSNQKIINIENEMIALVTKYGKSAIRQKKKNDDFKSFYQYVMESDLNEITKNIQFDEFELMADLNLMLNGATDTTFVTLEYSMALLVKYPLIQEKIYNELVTIYGKTFDIDNIKLNIQNIALSVSLRAFIHEVLRIYPPAPNGVARENLNDKPIEVKLNNGKIYNIPKYSWININIIGIGRKQRFWTKQNDKILNMEHIHLEFWLDENGKFRKNKSFLSFLIGKRNCPGKDLAIRELIIILTIFILKYKWTTIPNKPVIIQNVLENTMCLKNQPTIFPQNRI